MIRLTRRDWVLLAVCLAVTVASLIIIDRWFGAAFPEDSIEFRYDRSSSGEIATALLRAQRLDTTAMKHTVVFDSDDTSRIFLERTLGLEDANAVMKRDVRVWYWHHRWYKPLQEEEYSIDVAPTGEIVSFHHTIPEARAMPAADLETARRIAEAFLPEKDLTFLSHSERTLPARVQRIFTWESKSVRPGGASYRHIVTVDGNTVTSYEQGLKVPDEWIRTYQELRSKNASAGRVDLIFMLITTIAALAVFVARLRRGDLQIRFLLTVGAVTAVLVAGVTLNSIPSALAGYDTSTSYPAFMAQLVVLTIMQAIGSGMLMIVICGAGEVLYRERLQNQLAIPRLWTVRALASKRVFLSLILGNTLVAFFIAYQVVFYVIAARFGAWAPADVPYDDILNTAFPWIAVLFAGFFPAFSEEFLSRAFSIPFFEKVFRSRLFAIVFSGFVWGFGHSTYPNQPFYIRGIEVGVAGVLLGLLMYRYGLLALLVFHYTVDAVYTSLLLFRSGNAYYITSAGVASLVFAIPLIASVVLLIRNRGFIPDDDLTNATLPIQPAADPVSLPPAVPLPPPLRPSREAVAVCLALLALAVSVAMIRQDSPGDVVDYRIDGAEAKRIALDHLKNRGPSIAATVAATPVSGFRSWEAGSRREDGGSSGSFDSTAATYMVRKGMTMDRLMDVLRNEIHAATWMVRVFTPMMKTESFVEVDARTASVVGYHQYRDEAAPGPQLTRDAALSIARGAFAGYGVAADDFQLKEALSFQQPARRDWLFHFEQRTALVAAAARRVTIRVMGDQVTQFVNTVKVPDSVYREASQQTLITVVLIIFKVAGVIGGMALVIAGAIMATRHGQLPWRRAGRMTLVLALVPIAGAISRYESHLFAYNTSVTWETFRLNLITDVVQSAGLRILLLFVASAGILAVFPFAPGLLTREARRRLGLAAAVSAVTALSILALLNSVSGMFVSALPRLASIEEISIPGAIAIPFPSLLEAAEALFGTIIICGGVALFVTALRNWPKKTATLATLFILFAASLDISVLPAEIPLMIVSTAVFTLTIWLIARLVLRDNVLAWPVVIFTASLLQGGLALIGNHRTDLILHGSILLALGAITLLWVSLGSLKEAPVTP